MAKKKFFDYYTELPGWGKGLVAAAAVGALVALYFVGRNIYEDIKRKKDKRKAVEDAKDDLDKLARKGIRPSYNDSQYKVWADELNACFQGWGSCTGVGVFASMKNDADLLKLIIAFGRPTIDSGSWNVFAKNFTGTLPEVIRDELSATQIENINKGLNKNGLTYQF